MPTLVLASTSPFRRALLEKLQLYFTTDPPEIDECRHVDETAEQLVARLACEKARAVAPRHPLSLIVGSDQIAVNGLEFLGKPINHKDAATQLRTVSGKRITFYTGLCLHNSATGSEQIAVELFHVHFRNLSDNQIDTYLKRERPYGCTGSFKSEALGIALLNKMEGDDPNTLIGLPIIRLVEMLEKEGIDVI